MAKRFSGPAILVAMYITLLAAAYVEVNNLGR